jgi:hypothetical protein
VAGSSRPGRGMDTTATVTELDALLEQAGKRGFVWHLFRPDHHGPEVLAGVFQWADCADVVVLSDPMHAHAYRVPTDDSADVFAPARVLWWYGQSPVWTLRALLALPSPDHPQAPRTLTAAPQGTGVPGDRRPVRMRRRGR